MSLSVWTAKRIKVARFIQDIHTIRNDPFFQHSSTQLLFSTTAFSLAVPQGETVFASIPTSRRFPLAISHTLLMYAKYGSILLPY
ncbi:archaeal atpase family protein [Lasius niger]|uniref:Archaeal atpase family protein n=1 Tax=Lasius niger TaxID=67767 RepID=A0A0J7KFH0_LASNI|nr:archaeal atpase family protein [Lasius niger]